MSQPYSVGTSPEQYTGGSVNEQARHDFGQTAKQCCHNGGMLQRAAINEASAPTAPPIVHDVLSSPGQPLGTEAQALMEQRFGHDFSGVRVHTDANAASAAEALHAQAFTRKQDIFFNAGKYQPDTRAGQFLLAHELAHTIQQSSAQPLLSQSIYTVSQPNSTMEREAENAAHQVHTSPALAPHISSVAAPTTQNIIARRTIEEATPEIPIDASQEDNTHEDVVEKVRIQLAEDPQDSAGQIRTLLLHLDPNMRSQVLARLQRVLLPGEWRQVNHILAIPLPTSNAVVPPEQQTTTIDDAQTSQASLPLDQKSQSISALPSPMKDAAASQLPSSMNQEILLRNLAQPLLKEQIPL